MAPKAQKTSKRNRKTSRPRRSSARIAQERVRSRSRSAPSEPPRRARSGAAAKKKSSRQPAKKTNRKTQKKTTKAQPRKSPPRKRPAKRGGTKVRRLKSREREPVVRRGRLVLWLVVMAVFGFGTVYVVDAAFRTLGSIEVSQGEQVSLWDKLVDRMLDRDVPRLVGDKPSAPKANVKPKAEAKPPAANKPAPAEPTPAPRPKVESLPRAEVPKTPRADLPAISPDEYAKSARAAEPGKAERAKAEPAQAEPAPPRTREEAAEQSRRRIDAILEKVGVPSR
jgi:hypothetical protein